MGHTKQSGTLKLARRKIGPSLYEVGYVRFGIGSRIRFNHT